MANCCSSSQRAILLLFFLCNSAFLFASTSSAEDEASTYIIHVLPKANSIFSSALDRIGYYESFLPDKSRLLYSYGKIMNGFAARLSPRELAALKLLDGFVHAIPDYTLSLQTTRSLEFLGLSRNAPGLWNDSSFGRGVIIGVLDTGIKVGHPSFADNGLLPPPPAKWKGSCEFNASDCNNKLIGARTFLNGKEGGPPYEDVEKGGHGTHTASTAAGMFVGGANVDGQANGTAAGVAPYAHLAVYKVCSTTGCDLSDVMAGLDSAVEDGVDVVSISIGNNNGSAVSPFYDDGIAIGAFGAIEQGVFVSCSAGNNGPNLRTLSNEAPWILTVGASSIDRLVEGILHLNNGPVILGQTLYQPADFPSSYYPLVYPGGVAGAGFNASYCISLQGVNVTGMVVVCDDHGGINRVEKGRVVKEAGGVAMIIANLNYEGYTTSSDPHVLPALHISYADGLQLKSYLQSEASPMAAITFDGTILGTTPAPAVAYFSSRGPNKLVDILKPDIIGPGLNILAAWHVHVGEPTASSTFNIISGTSMSAPHLSGVAALLKSVHPDWSPAAIKSAIMTSAYNDGNDGQPIRDETFNAANFFAIGAGHVDPSKAANPGLIYDILPENYIAYLCGLNYDESKLSMITGRPVSCSDYLSLYGEELNYPSFMVALSAANGYTAVVSRNVTNVGSATSSYAAQVTAPVGVSVTVNPAQLSFTQANQVLQYTMSFSGDSSGTGSRFREGILEWVSSDEAVTVRSPIMVALR